MQNDTLPEGVRQVPGPAVHWQIGTNIGLQWDGYVFEDDPSDLAKFMRWLAEQPSSGPQLRLTVNKVLR